MAVLCSNDQINFHFKVPAFNLQKSQSPKVLVAFNFLYHSHHLHLSPLSQVVQNKQRKHVRLHAQTFHLYHKRKTTIIKSYEMFKHTWNQVNHKQQWPNHSRRKLREEQKNRKKKEEYSNTTERAWWTGDGRMREQKTQSFTSFYHY